MKLRMAELLFVEVMRRYLETLPSGQTGWLAGLRDPLVARALALLHNAPAQDWTLDALAAQAATSRSVLAERFVHFIGQPPMQYLRAAAHAVGKSIAGRRRCQGSLRCSGRRFRIRGCLQSRLQEMRRPFTGRMATTTSGMTGAPCSIQLAAPAQGSLWHLASVRPHRLMISHRLSTISDGDEFVVLNDGVVAEEGSPDELLTRGGVYAELHRIQYALTQRSKN